MLPKISVIIPVFNGSNYIASAIQSVLSQNYPHIELVVIDDGSVDQTADIVKSFGPLVQYYYQENRGLGAARNAGVRYSTGDFIAFIDHDDLWLPNKISVQMDVWKDNRMRDPLVFAQLQQFISDELDEADRKKLSLSKQTITGCCASALLLSRKRFEETGNFFELKSVGEFIDWYQRVCLKEIPCVTVDEVLVKRRIHLSNMGRQKALYERTGYLKVLKAGLKRKRQKDEADVNAQ